MYTLCPHCEAVHPVNAAVLGQARGQVRCGRCRQHFDATANLYDDRPRRGPRSSLGGRGSRNPKSAIGHKAAPGETAAGVARGTEPPILMPGATPVEPGPERPPAAPTDAPSTWTWPLLLAILGLLTIVHLGSFLREQLPPDSPLLQRLQAWQVPGFDADDQATDRMSPPGRMHLVSRDLHSHPTRAGVLVLSATFVNLSAGAQPYPKLTLLLLDRDSRPLQGRSFEPSEYLAAAADGERLAPGQHVPVLLEFADPGERAVGFEVTFH